MMIEWARVMDKLYLTGLSQLFTVVALSAAQKLGVATNSTHLDSSSFHVHGKYENNLPQVAFIKEKFNRENPHRGDVEETFAPNPIEITYGYSRDHRPDLKQFILDLICSGDGDVPLFLRVADGNEADKAVFAQVLCDFRNQLTLDTLMVADSALYSAPNLEQMKALKWLCRVPLTVKQAKLLVSQLNEKDFVKSAATGYCLAERTSNYGGIEQRWIVVESQARRESELRRLEKNLEKASKTVSKKLQNLGNQKFDNPQTAITSATQLAKNLKYHKLADIKVVELQPEPIKKASALAGNIIYKIQASLVRDQSGIDTETRCAGRFVLVHGGVNNPPAVKPKLLGGLREICIKRLADYF
jgi:transposase